MENRHKIEYGYDPPKKRKASVPFLEMKKGQSFDAPTKATAVLARGYAKAHGIDYHEERLSNGKTRFWKT